MCLQWCMPITAPRMQPLDSVLTISFLVGSLDSLWMLSLGYRGETRGGTLGESNYVSQLRRRLKFAHNKAKQIASKQQARHKGLYDRKCRGAILDVGDLVLVKQTAWKGRHKIQDRWEEDEYQVVDQPTPGIPVYVVKSIAGGRPRVLHRNLLLPLQGRLRQEGATGEGSNADSDSEGETPEPPQVPMWEA